MGHYKTMMVQQSGAALYNHKKMAQQESCIITSSLGNVPEIRTIGPRSNDNIPLNNLCSRNLPQNTQIDCEIVPFSATSLTTRLWRIDGVIDNRNASAISVLGPGNYTCTIIHPCGTRSIGPFFIPQSKCMNSSHDMINVLQTHQ